MLFRQGAGGIVFHGDRVLLLQEEGDEWVLPRSALGNGGDAGEVVRQRVREGAGVEADIVAPAGEASYQVAAAGSRRNPVCDQIIWFLMEAKEDTPAAVEGVRDGRFFSLEEALDRVSSRQDRSLLRVSYEKMRGFWQRGA